MKKLVLHFEIFWHQNNRLIPFFMNFWKCLQTFEGIQPFVVFFLCPVPLEEVKTQVQRPRFFFIA